MIARASVAAVGNRLTRLRSEPPLVFRETPDGLYLVGAAAGPIGGDELAIDLELVDGARLTVRSAAASIVLPGPSLSSLRITARVGAGCWLRWIPEPTVLAEGCRHSIETSIEVAAGGRLDWREELVLGRHGESSGSATTRLAIDYDGAPLVHHELGVGPAHPVSQGPAVLGASARAVGSVVLVGGTLPERPALLGDAAAVLPLEGPGVMVTALGADARSMRRSLACALDGHGESLASAAEHAASGPVPERPLVGHGSDMC